ncbi:general transcription factor II-I repeat domain-containing protein 2-like [Tachysurus ichikawai]
MAEKQQKTYHFHSVWEEEVFFTSVKEKCLICRTTVVTAKRHNVARHFRAGVALLNDHIYVVGGFDGTAHLSSFISL